jgi:hypothetical protein
VEAHAKERAKGAEVNSDPGSEDTCRGIPCFENTCDTKVPAMSWAVTESVVGIKTLSLEKRSTTTKIVVYPLDSGNCSMMSMLIECHGRSGIERGCRRP